MEASNSHAEGHAVSRLGWLRAAVLGANDGIISTSSLILGVAASAANKNTILVVGVAGLVAGSMSMASGEYVSVKSQADAEKADLHRETKELRDDVDFEREELTNIYVSRGLSRPLALEVATQLMDKDALAAHARDELGISEFSTARPIQAGLTSAAAFASGAFLPVLIALLAPLAHTPLAVAGGSILLLAALGAVGAHAGGAPILPGVVRVTFWGVLAMAFTALVGRLFGAVV